MPDYFDTGFCVREASWHGKENLLTDYPESWDDARLAAGLMWEPRIIPLYRQVTTPAGDVEYVVAKGAAQVERDDTGDVIAPRVSDTFELIGNGAMGEIVEAILEQENVKWETAGSVRNGAMVWVLVRLDEPYTTTGDVLADGEQVQTFPYLTLLNSHDGTGACKVAYTQVRVVCWNTIQAADAEADKHGFQFSFRHTAGVNDRISDAQEALKGARIEAKRWQELTAELFSYRFDQAMTDDFLEQFLPTPPTGTASDRVVANVMRDRGTFVEYLHKPQNEELAHTGLGVVNTAIEWLDHVRGWQNRDTYLGRTLWKPEPRKAQAIHIVRELAGAGA